MARARGEESEMNNVTARRLLPPGRQALCITGWTTTGDVLAARPTPLVEVRAIAGGTAARRGAHRGHRAVRADPRCACAAVGDRVVDLLREIDAPALVEQVIAVPKISMDRVPQRSVCRRSRTDCQADS